MKSSQKYELMLLFPPDRTEKEQLEHLESIKEQIQELGGNILDSDIWGIRDLAYRIKRHKSGFYSVLLFDFMKNKIKELESFLHLEQSILRYLLTLPPQKVNHIMYTYQELQAEEERLKKERATEKEQYSPHPTALPARKNAEPEKEIKEKPESLMIAEELDKKLSKIIDEEIKI